MCKKEEREVVAAKKLAFSVLWGKKENVKVAIFKNVQIHSNLDITNKSVIPFLFTISNNSQYQM